MDKYQSFVLDERNSWEAPDARYFVSMHHHKNAEDQAAFRKAYGAYRCHDSYESAVSALRERMSKLRAHLEKQIAQLDYNEAHFETLYPAPVDLLAELEGQYEALVDGLRGLQQTPGRFQVGRLGVTNDYLGRGEHNLFIFDLPEWGCTPQTFSGASCEVVCRAMNEVGLEVASEWNGAGFFSWSRRTREPVAQAA